MKNILILSYYFPPNAGAHVQRITKFVKYLPEYGYKPIVLTNHNKTKRRDSILFKEIKDIEIYYSKNIGKLIPGKIRKVFPRLSTPDKLINWKFTVVRKALEIVKQEKVDIIIASVPPHSIGYIASLIAAYTKLPLVLDFRDEWITFPLFKNKTNKKLQFEMYKNTLNRTDGLTTVNQTFLKRIKKSYSFSENFVSKVIYNGFDTSDIPQSTDKNKSKKVKICYPGRFKKVSDPSLFFSVINKMLSTTKISHDKIEFLCLGDEETNKKWLKNYPEVKNITNFYGYLPLKKVYEVIKKADIGLLILTNYGNCSTFPLKMFDYFAVKKPILAFVEKEDELTDCIRKYGGSRIIITEEEEQIEKQILDFFNKVKNEDYAINFNYRDTFQRKKQTRELKKVLDKVVDNDK